MSFLNIKIPFWKDASSNKWEHGTSNSSNNFCCRHIKKFRPIGNVGIFEEAWRNVNILSLSDVDNLLLSFDKLSKRLIRVWIIQILIILSREIIFNVPTCNIIHFILNYSSLLWLWLHNVVEFIRNFFIVRSFLCSNEYHFLIFLLRPFQFLLLLFLK